MVADSDRAALDTAFKESRKRFPQKVAMDPVIVGIDEKFVASVDEPLTLNHFYLTEFFQAMAQAKPSVVGVDLELPDKRYETIVSTSHPTQDFHRELLLGLMQAVQQIKIIVVKVFDFGRHQFHNIHLDYVAVLGMQEHQPAIASAMLAEDPDSRYRWYPDPAWQPDHTGHTLTSEMSAALGIHKSWSGLINYRLGEPFKYVPLQDVREWMKKGDVRRLQQEFGGKPVLLGIVLEDTDIKDVPVRLASFRPENDLHAPGVLVHAQILRSMWNQGFIHPLPRWALFSLCALFACFWFGESILGKFRLLLAASAALLIACALLFLKNIWLPPTAILMTGWIGFSSQSVLQAWRSFKEKQHMKRVFSGSVSPAVMQEIIKGGLEIDQKSTRRALCVLFSDIRNFTTMCEYMQAEDVVSLLNRYFARMVHVIHKYGGTVDKFIGDGLMAFFGAPNPLEHPEQNALNAARDMLAALAELNAELAAEGKQTLQIGVGLHSGEAVIGQIGSEERHEYTAIGDTVNTASRIEGLCKEVGHGIVCSEYVAKAVGYPEGLVALGERALKGRAAVMVYGWSASAYDANPVRTGT
jgi:class 3 adenylate cyclase/CHASE2 domain-containing sensor protein